MHHRNRILGVVYDFFYRAREGELGAGVRRLVRAVRAPRRSVPSQAGAMVSKVMCTTSQNQVLALGHRVSRACGRGVVWVRRDVWTFITRARVRLDGLGSPELGAALHIDPHTAQVTVRGDPFPHILVGIPLRTKHVNADIDRPGFTFNPTSCEPMSVAGTTKSTDLQGIGRSGQLQIISGFRSGAEQAWHSSQGSRSPPRGKTNNRMGRA
jgi:hypothetical protein